MSAALVMVGAWNPDQARDETGRWTDQGDAHYMGRGGHFSVHQHYQTNKFEVRAHTQDGVRTVREHWNETDAHAHAMQAARGLRLAEEGLVFVGAYSEDQPRDDHGRWTDEGTSGSVSWDSTSAPEEAVARITRVSRRMQNVSEEMGYDHSRISIVDKDPREFEVGGLQFKEAGHYNPTTDTIEINARMVDSDMMATTNAIVAHEVSHAQFAEVRKMQDEEHAELGKMSSADAKKYFDAGGNPRPQHMKYLEEKYPASALFARTIGDAYLGPGVGFEKLKTEDGVSSYSRAYWSIDALNRMGGTLRAIDETNAEVRRMMFVPNSFEGDTTPGSVWLDLASGIGRLYRNRKGK